MSYVILKWIHVLSSTLLFGTGLGSAYYMLLTSLTRDARAVSVVLRHVVLADWLFTSTTVVIQPVTGVLMARMAGWPLSTPWLAWSIGLYFLAGACWLPVVWLQLRMREMANDAAARGTPLPPRYWQFLRWWVLPGVPAFVALVVVFYLMVAKPS
ncbi:DUF2269 family protein [Ideonella sp. YS5]|uniref:DUF2269 family protein n=1 Tax=Ideonella sp. YS5 TaxID=3453714 RepID=UPI003EEEB84E